MTSKMPTHGWWVTVSAAGTKGFRVGSCRGGPLPRRQRRAARPGRSGAELRAACCRHRCAAGNILIKQSCLPRRRSASNGLRATRTCACPVHVHEQRACTCVWRYRCSRGRRTFRRGASRWAVTQASQAPLQSSVRTRTCSHCTGDTWQDPDAWAIAAEAYMNLSPWDYYFDKVHVPDTRLQRRHAAYAVAS